MIKRLIVIAKIKIFTSLNTESSKRRRKRSISRKRRNLKEAIESITKRKRRSLFSVMSLKSNR